jgi:hypothetical protein
VDNLLAAAWTLLAVLNFTVKASVFADLAVGMGAAATLVLTVLRIYEHLVGEPVSDTLFTQNEEAEA